MRTVVLNSGEALPALGQGTWGMAENPRRRAEEISALRVGIELGMTLIDTAEMYANGAAEELVGEAISGRRDEVFLVSKVLPGNATRRGTVSACERSLSRLGTDRIDLYLLHWRGEVPIESTWEAMSDLQQSGKIRYYGVSNFDVADMNELWRLPGGEACATDQVLYNLSRRGIEYDLLPWCRQAGVPVMAYSPIEQGRLLTDAALQSIARRRGSTPAQVGLSWLLRQEGVISIPKAGTAAHLRENAAAADLLLSDKDLREIDEAFPPPGGPRPLEML